jgi:hypothetical protein
MSSILASEASYIFQKGSSDKFGAVVVESATLPDGDGGGVARYVFTSQKAAWFCRFVTGEAPYKRPLEATSFMRSFAELAWCPPTESQAKLSRLDLDCDFSSDDDDAAVLPSGVRAKTGDVVYVNLAMSSSLWSLVDKHESGDVENVRVQVWLRGGRLFVRDDATMLNAIKAHLLRELSLREGEGCRRPCERGRGQWLPSPFVRPKSRGSWWVKKGRKERGYWLVRLREQGIIRKFRLMKQVFFPLLNKHIEIFVLVFISY